MATFCQVAGRQAAIGFSGGRGHARAHPSACVHVCKRGAACLVASGWWLATCPWHTVRFWGVKEVKEGYECGIGVENFNDIKVGDLIEIYRTENVARTLQPASAS